MRGLIQKNENMDIAKCILRVDDFYINNSKSRETTSPTKLQKDVHISNASLSFEFLNQNEKTAGANFSPHKQGAKESEATEIKLVSEFFCDAELRVNIADQIDVKAKVKVGEVFVKVSQKLILYLMLHLKSRRSTTRQQANEIRQKSTLQKFQYLGSPL